MHVRSMIFMLTTLIIDSIFSACSMPNNRFSAYISKPTVFLWCLVQDKKDWQKQDGQARYFGWQVTVLVDVISHYLGIVSPQIHSGTITYWYT